jgi:hypothetical protein
LVQVRAYFFPAAKRIFCKLNFLCASRCRLFITEVGALAFLTSEVSDRAVRKSDGSSKMLHFVRCGVAAKTAIVDFDESLAVPR